MVASDSYTEPKRGAWRKLTWVATFGNNSLLFGKEKSCLCVNDIPVMVPFCIGIKKNEKYSLSTRRWNRPNSNDATVRPPAVTIEKLDKNIDDDTAPSLAIPDYLSTCLIESKFDFFANESFN